MRWKIRWFKLVTKQYQDIKANNSTGCDGFLSEWYRNFKEELILKLIKSFNYNIKEDLGQRPEGEQFWNFLESIIFAINSYGGGKIWNIVASVVSDPYSNWLKDMYIHNCQTIWKILTYLIDEDQTGAISGCETQDSIRRRQLTRYKKSTVKRVLIE